MFWVADKAFVSVSDARAVGMLLRDTHGSGLSLSLLAADAVADADADASVTTVLL
jgi:hypothetical protein